MSYVGKSFYLSKSSYEGENLPCIGEKVKIHRMTSSGKYVFEHLNKDYLVDIEQLSEYNPYALTPEWNRNMNIKQMMETLRTMQQNGMSNSELSRIVGDMMEGI